MARTTRRTILGAALSMALLGATTNKASAVQVDTDGMHLDLPAWSLIFKKNGSINRSRLGSGEAFYAKDVISNGVAVDPTVLFRRIKELPDGKKRVVIGKNRIVKTTVKAANDLGPVYLVTDVTPSATRAVYVAADVLTRNVPHNIKYEFELTQKRFEIVPHSGNRRLTGVYTDGDLRAIVKFRRGNPYVITVNRFNNKTAGRSGWSTMMKKRFDSSNCVNDDDNVTACVTTTPNGGAVRSAKKRRNSKGKRVRVPQTDMRIEIGLEIDELSGVHVGWDTMLVRSKHDLAIMPLVNGVEGDGSGDVSGGGGSSDPDDSDDSDDDIDADNRDDLDDNTDHDGDE